MSNLSQNITDTARMMKARDAAQLVGYTSDYVTRLAREGKVGAEKKGRQWMVDVDSLKLFSLQAEAEKRERQEELRLERVREHSRAVLAAEEQVVDSQISQSSRFAILETVALAICLFVAGSLFWFSAESDLDIASLTHGVEVVGSDLKSAVIDPLPDFMTQVASLAFVEKRGTSEVVEHRPLKTSAGSSDQATFEGIILFEEAQASEKYIHEIRESFSDEVQVDFDGRDTGVITPVFKEKEGAPYRFLLVPVDAIE